ncbi:hypothetical protein ACFC1D_21120 [Streptomyces vinaceus]|uniref:hypothetical protein n=1 Tax=Streptomyces vinaceus TaxID=1960 RepID=UPI0035D8B622
MPKLDPSLIEHKDLRSYVKALARYGEADPVPLLGPAPAHLELAERAVRPGSDQGFGAMVLCPADSEARPIAEALADALDGSLAVLEGPGSVASALGRPARSPYVLLIGLSHELTERHLHELNEGTWRAAASGTALLHPGVVTAPNLAGLAWQLAKGLSFPRRRRPDVEHARIWASVEGSPARHGQGEWFTRGETGRDAMLPRLTGRRTGVLSFLSHSRDDVLHLLDTVICAGGKRRPDVASVPGARLPVCAKTGRCFRADVSTERIIHASSLRADVVLVNACSSGRISDGLFADEYLLSHAVLGGETAAFVASPHPLNGHQVSGNLFHLALEHGASVGEAASTVNDHVRLEGIDIPGLSVFGLPWLTPGAPADSVAPNLVATAEDAAGSTAVAGRMISESTAHGTHTVIAHTSPRSGGITALAGPMAGPPTAGATSADELRRIGTGLTAFGRLRVMGITYPGQDRRLDQLERQAGELTRALRRTDSAAELEHSANLGRALAESLRAGERELADTLHDLGLHGFDNATGRWMGMLELRPVRPARRDCPYCDRRLELLTAGHPLFPVERQVLQCGRCRFVEDFDPAGPVSAIRIEAAETWYRADDTSATVVITPSATLTKPLAVTIGLCTPAAERHGVDFDAPVDRTLRPGEPLSVELSVRPRANAQLHQQFIQAFAIANGSLTQGFRPVWIET